MLAPTSGLASEGSGTGGAPTIPAIAAAALPMILVEIRFSPDTSTMLGTRIRSDSPM